MKLKEKLMVGAGTIMATAGAALPVFAAGSGANPAVAGIQTAITSVTADSATVIGGAIGLGVIFWAARVLWSKFKSMAK